MTDDSNFDIDSDNDPEDKYGRFYRDYNIDIQLIEQFAFAGEGGSVDLTNYYTKTQTNTLLDGKENVSDLTGSFYNKTQIDGFLANKADSSALNNYILASTRGAAAGVATLDNSIKVPFAQLPTGTSSSQVAIGNHTHASAGSQLAVRFAYISSGNVEMADSGGLWVPVTGFEISIPAVENDWIEADYDCAFLSSAGAHYDLAIIVGSTLVRFLATGTTTPGDEGDIATSPDSPASVIAKAGARGFNVISSHIDSGNVRIALVTKTTGGGTVLANSDNNFYWQLKNFGQHT